MIEITRTKAGSSKIKFVQPIRLDVKVQQTRGTDLKRRSVPGGKLKSSAIGSGEVGDNSVSQSSMQDNAIGRPEMRDDAIRQDELDTEDVNLTVTAGQSSGTATVLSGSRVDYVRPTAQDQIIKSVTISGTTLTLTLLANATANNTFVITLLKS